MANSDNEALRPEHLAEVELARLRNELANARRAFDDMREEYGELTRALGAVAADRDADADAFRYLACAAVERVLRDLNVYEVRLWVAPWYGGLGERYSITLTYRNGIGEQHGSTLHEAIKAAQVKP
jgi:hypothetical protein